MRRRARLGALMSSLALAGCSVVGVRDGTEEPAFTVAGQVGQVEIRQYGPRIAAETVIAGDEDAALRAGFRRVAAYIFGANKTGGKIAMTAPVAQSSETIAMTAPVAQSRDAQGRYVVRFFMPAQYSLATLPTPNDPGVHLVEIPGETMAVLRFSGLAGVDRIATQRTALLAALQNSPWQPAGTPVTWFYDPPWTIPFFRRNEVAVPVRPMPAPQ
jgi:hypothetical protein